MPGPFVSTSKLFAGDSLLFRGIKTEDDSAIPNRELKKLEWWETNLLVNSTLKNVQLSRLLAAEVPYRHHTPPMAIRSILCRKYLCIAVNEKRSWNSHINDITKKASNSLRFLRRTISRCQADTKAQCYTTLVYLPYRRVCGNTLLQNLILRKWQNFIDVHVASYLGTTKNEYFCKYGYQTACCSGHIYNRDVMLQS